jgi:tRNA (cytidine32/uridine32-2'-O)-methyltransferase
VQVLCYELRLAAESLRLPAPSETLQPKSPDDRAATVAELEGLFGHLERALHAIDFFKGRSPVTIMRRFRRLYHRAALSRREVLILRGMLSDAERSAGFTPPSRTSRTCS